MKTILEISNHLRERQKAKGISQQDLREAAGLSRQTMSRVLSGTEDFKLSTLLAVADRLGLELELVPRGMGSKLGERPTEPKVTTRVSRALSLITEIAGPSKGSAPTPASGSVLPGEREGEGAHLPGLSGKEPRQ